jgi:hypothetical protein
MAKVVVLLMTQCLLLCVCLILCVVFHALLQLMVQAISSVSKPAMLALAGAMQLTTTHLLANPTTEDTTIWQIVLQDLNVQFPIRTAALDDIDGLEANVVDDMLAEFAQARGALDDAE